VRKRLEASAALEKEEEQKRTEILENLVDPSLPKNKSKKEGAWANLRASIGTEHSVAFEENTAKYEQLSPKQPALNQANISAKKVQEREPFQRRGHLYHGENNTVRSFRDVTPLHHVMDGESVVSVALDLQRVCRPLLLRCLKSDDDQV
jgi:hypothetical protein